LTESKTSGILFHSRHRKALLLSALGFIFLTSQQLVLGQRLEKTVRIEEAGILRGTSTDEILELSENVRLSHGNTKLNAERVIYNRIKGLLQLTGSVTIVRNSTTFMADEVTYQEANQIMVGSGKVMLKDSVEAMTLMGGKVEYSQDPHQAIATVKPKMKWGQAKGDITITGDYLEYHFTEFNTLLKAFAKGSVVFHDVREEISISSDSLEYFKPTETARFNGSPEFIKLAETPQANIVVKGETMIYNFDKRSAEVFDSVSIVRGLVGGKCDTLIFDNSKKQVDLLGDPVVQNSDSQLRGQRIVLEFKEDTIMNALVHGHASGSYTVQKTNERYYSTISGDNVIVKFDGETVKELTVLGEALSTYEIATVGNDNNSKPNEIHANKIIIRFEQGQPVEMDADGNVTGIYLIP